MAWRNKGTGQISNSSSNPGIIYGSGQYTPGIYNNGMDANVWEQIPTSPANQSGVPGTSAVSGHSPVGSSRPLLSPAAIKFLAWLVTRLVAILIVVGLPLAAVMYIRGYLSFDGGSVVINSLPALKTSNGIAYRKFDMNMEFRNRNIWTKPEEVKPNSYIEAGPIWDANLVCPQGDFTVKGDLRGGRIYVPNGTLTVEGGILSSFVAARHIKIDGPVHDSVESGTTISNGSRVDARSRLYNISAHRPVVEFIPFPFAPHTAGR